MASFEALLAAGWAEHGEHPNEVAERLASSLDAITLPAHVDPFARLVTHVFGEHLGEWQRGTSLLAAVRVSAACDEAGAAAIARLSAGLGYASGDDASVVTLAREDAAFALAVAAAACAGRTDFARAMRAYQRALELAAPGLSDGSPALRMLAIGGNSVAIALEEKPTRTAQENAAMIAAARGGLVYWKRAGSWLEEERAEFRLARSLAIGGEPLVAAAHARRCLAVCDANAAPAFERFFGEFALAEALRAAGEDAGFADARQRALTLLAEVPPDERRWCDAERRALGP